LRAALSLLICLACAAPLGAAFADAPQRIVFVRHGEKPAKGLGQLDCRGLNRALALPAFFAKAFGRPDAIFAPNPSVEKKDAGATYAYVRPLATIEPTAIALGLPVNVEIGFADIEGLQKALEATHGLVFVAWEHRIIDVVARNLLAAHGGNPSAVPGWKDDDFDGVYVVTLAEGAAAKFERTSEGLNGQPEACPR